MADREYCSQCGNWVCGGVAHEQDCPHREPPELEHWSDYYYEKDYDRHSEVLNDAHEAVYERDSDDSFETIARLWGEYFQTDVSASDVAYAMILLKIGRRMNGNDSSDIPTDIAGYAENAARFE